jgi:hypothetical protein
MIPLRKAIIYLIDSSGKLYPVKVTVLPDGTALLPISIEKDIVGLATESTLSGIKAQTDKLIFDEVGRVYVRETMLDESLSTARSKVNIQSIGGVPQTGEDWTPHIKNLDNLATEANLNHLTVEGAKRCFDVVVDDVYAVPAGESWYVKNLTIDVDGELYLDGDVVIVG